MIDYLTFWRIKIIFKIKEKDFEQINNPRKLIFTPIP
jgi:hypothetical protein